jgi:hypothetical protein
MFKVGEKVRIIDVPHYDEDDSDLVGTVGTIDEVGEFLDWQGSLCQYLVEIPGIGGDYEYLSVRPWQLCKVAQLQSEERLWVFSRA